MMMLMMIYVQCCCSSYSVEIVGDDGRGDVLLRWHSTAVVRMGANYSLSYGISELARFLWARDLEKDLI